MRDNAILFGLPSRDVEGLVVVQEYVTRHNGAQHVAFQQTDSQRVVHGSLLRLTLDSAGRVLTAGGALFPGAAASGEPSLSAEKAASLAARDSGVRLVRPATAQLVTFPMPGRRPARLAWRALLQTDAGWLDTVVDAQTGRLLYRTDHRAYGSPHGTVFTVQHPDLGAAQVVSFSGAAFDNAGWVTDRATAGNNANAQTMPGQRPRMEIVADKGSSRDGAFDADHVTHQPAIDRRDRRGRKRHPRSAAHPIPAGSIR